MSSGQAGPAVTALNRQLPLVTMKSQPEAVGQQILDNCAYAVARFSILRTRGKIC
jgi:hypothetical protein